MTRLTTAQLDRAVGVLLATAAGDALGAGYEFGPPLPEEVPVRMKGGGVCHTKDAHGHTRKTCYYRSLRDGKLSFVS